MCVCVLLRVCVCKRGLDCLSVMNTQTGPVSMVAAGLFCPGDGGVRIVLLRGTAPARHLVLGPGGDDVVVAAGAGSDATATAAFLLVFPAARSAAALRGTSVELCVYGLPAQCFPWSGSFRSGIGFPASLLGFVWTKCTLFPRDAP